MVSIEFVENMKYQKEVFFLALLSDKLGSRAYNDIQFNEDYNYHLRTAVRCLYSYDEETDIYSKRGKYRVYDAFGESQLTNATMDHFMILEEYFEFLDKEEESKQN